MPRSPGRMGRRAPVEDEDEGEEGLELPRPTVQARVMAGEVYAELVWVSGGLLEKEATGEERVEMGVEEKERDGIRRRSCGWT
eukprot:evm.model.NODE_13191_length_7430_cov_33.337013.3